MILLRSRVHLHRHPLRMLFCRRRRTRRRRRRRVSRLTPLPLVWALRPCRRHRRRRRRRRP